ncbi:MAG: hypothetical protein R3D88_06450 [Alphaproteobacteria bacterium]
MNKTVSKNEENSKNFDKNQPDLPLETAKNRPKLLKFLIFLKDIFFKMALSIFMFFARRLEFALYGFLTFNPILIGLIFLEWWFYFEGFWVHVLPFFADSFFPTLIKFF